MKIKNFNQYLNESYDGSLSDLKYEFPLFLQQLTGNSPSSIKSISKKGNQFIVKTHSYINKQEMESIGIELNLTLINYSISNSTATSIFK